MSAWNARLGLLVLSSGLACAGPFSLTVRLQILESISNSADTFGGFALQIVTEPSNAWALDPSEPLWEVSPTGDLTSLLAASSESVRDYTAGAATIYRSTENPATFASGIDEVSYAFASVDSGSQGGDLARVSPFVPVLETEGRLGLMAVNR
jgi:hypothetical protein